MRNKRTNASIKNNKHVKISLSKRLTSYASSSLISATKKATKPRRPSVKRWLKSVHSKRKIRLSASASLLLIGVFLAHRLPLHLTRKSVVLLSRPSVERCFAQWQDLRLQLMLRRPQRKALKTTNSQPRHLARSKL